MQKYYAHTDSVRTDAKDFDFYVEVYLADDVDAKLKEYEEDNTGLSEAASKLCARIGTLETIIEAQRQTSAALQEALQRWMPPAPGLVGDDLTRWMADRELLSGE